MTMTPANPESVAATVATAFGSYPRAAAALGWQIARQGPGATTWEARNLRMIPAAELFDFATEDEAARAAVIHTAANLSPPAPEPAPRGYHQRSFAVTLETDSPMSDEDARAVSNAIYEAVDRERLEVGLSRDDAESMVLAVVAVRPVSLTEA